MHDGWCNENNSNYLSVVLGAILGPLFFLLSPEWSILFGGFVAGTIAFYVGELNVK